MFTGKMSNFWTMVSKTRRAKRSTACQMGGHTDETDMHHNYGIMRINVLKSIMWHGEKQ